MEAGGRERIKAGLRHCEDTLSTDSKMEMMCSQGVCFSFAAEQRVDTNGFTNITNNTKPGDFLGK